MKFRIFVQVALLVSLQVASSYGAIYCKDEAGNDVDWWISYKVPRLDAPGNLATGYSYAYFTGKNIKGRSANIKGWKLSEKLVTDPESLYGKTLAPMYAEPSKYTIAMYNDDPPGDDKESSYWAHAKGVLAMDKETGFWLIHSVPNFVPKPAVGYEYPESGRLNGQTLMCISFSTPKEGNEIATQLVYMRPNIYNLDITPEVEALAPSLVTLRDKEWPKESNQNTLEIKSIKGESFTSFSRNSKASRDGDLYGTMVAPGLESDLLVETWRRGAGGPLTSNCTGGKYKIMNIDTVNLPLTPDSAAKETTAWKYLSDHAKWAVTASSSKPFVCIGDINRMASQYKRGGGTVCFKNPTVWNIARNSVNSLEPCAKP